VSAELGQRLRDHRSAPHHGLLGVDQKADRHGDDAVARERLDVLAVGRVRTLAAQAEHERLARAVDIGIEHTDASTLSGPRKSKICGDRRLAHPALARGDGDDILHSL